MSSPEGNRPTLQEGMPLTISPHYFIDPNDGTQTGNLCTSRSGTIVEIFTSPKVPDKPDRALSEILGRDAFFPNLGVSAGMAECDQCDYAEMVIMYRDGRIELSGNPPWNKNE